MKKRTKLEVSQFLISKLITKLQSKQWAGGIKDRLKRPDNRLGNPEINFYCIQG